MADDDEVKLPEPDMGAADEVIARQVDELMDRPVLGVEFAPPAEPVELGAAFKDSDTAARVFTGAPATADIDVRDEPSGPWLRPAVDRPATPVSEPRTLTVQRSGDDEVDAMLMLRAVMDSVESPIARRRLLGWLADRYA